MFHGMEIVQQQAMSPTMMIVLSPPAGPQASSPGLAPSSNSTSSSVLSTNAAQSVMIGETNVCANDLTFTWAEYTTLMTLLAEW